MNKNETPIRPMGRVTARPLSQEEAEQISGGMTWGISNTGALGDRDLFN